MCDERTQPSQNGGRRGSWAAKCDERSHRAVCQRRIGANEATELTVARIGANEAIAA
jgi:hypothetical protein